MLQRILRILSVVIVSAVLVAAAFMGGFATSRVLSPPRPDNVRDNAPTEFRASMGLFWQAWNLVRDQFYKPDKLDPTAMTYGAIGGMVGSLGDPHTAFVEPRRAQIINSDLEGAFEGIGATVEMRSGRLVIVAPIQGSPADKAGLKANDTVLKVGDTPIQDMSLEAAIALIRGPKGTQVNLTVQRGSTAAFTVQITRDRIQVPFVVTKQLENNIYYIKLNEFGETAAAEIHAALLQAQATKPRAIIIDLRSNPGGFLDAAIKIASEFLKPGQTVLIEQGKSGDRQEFKTQGSGVATDVPLVLLVNEGSASASEILSGAIRDYKRGTLIGTKTYGKGSVQTPHALSDQSQLRVTIAHFLSPKGLEINDVGVLPDIAVPDPTDAEILQNKDPQLDRAIQFILSGVRLDPVDSSKTGWLPLPCPARG